jgi:SAM-dependent methyltransferase
MGFIIKTECRICNNKLVEILDLNKQPLANSFVKEKDIDKQMFYPLKLMLCDKCFLSQLSVVVDPAILFEDYIYVSGTTQTQLKHFEHFCDQSINETKNITNSVLDIGCNDGSQLDYFLKRGYSTYGVDPAQNLFPTSSQKKHSIICDYFDIHFAEKLNNKKFDIIIAQNVFAHVDNVIQFLEACRILMHDDSNLYIRTSQANMVEDRQFDTVYHEHLSFFSIHSMVVAAEKANLFLNRVTIDEIHGGSYIFKIGRKVKQDGSFEHLRDLEKEAGRYSLSTYSKFTEDCLKFKKNLCGILDDFRDDGYALVGFGAPAKSNVVLNFCQIKLDYVVDENKLKQGLYTPGSNIVVRDIEYLKNDSRKKLIVFLAWNFCKEIEEKLIKNGIKNYKTLVYFPEIIVGSDFI